MVIENLALHDQIGQLEIYCDYGVTADGKQDEDGCPQLIHLADRKGHLEICEYCPVVCPNSDDCPPMKRRDLANHLENCNKARCRNHDKGCPKVGEKETIQGMIYTAIFLPSILINNDLISIVECVGPYKSVTEHETNCIFALMGDALTNAISAKLGTD